MYLYCMIYIYILTIHMIESVVESCCESGSHSVTIVIICVYQSLFVWHAKWLLRSSLLSQDREEERVFHHSSSVNTIEKASSNAGTISQVYIKCGHSCQVSILVSAFSTCTMHR